MALARGEDVNTYFGFALGLAAENNHAETVRLLLDNGANLHAGLDKALFVSAASGYTDCVAVLLDHYDRLKYNVRVDINTLAMKLAVKNGHRETVKLLIKRGAYGLLHDADLKSKIHKFMLG